VPSNAGYPRRTASGLDGSRLAMILAVLERRAATVLKEHDVYASTVGGVRLQEPAVDLALALALAGAKTNLPGPAGLVAIGEVGLAGDVRRVGAVGRRLAEAARLGFTRALVPAGSGATAPAGLTVTEVDTLGRALAAAR
jgi:DNA repair protein RadA/Sms